MITEEELETVEQDMLQMDRPSLKEGEKLCATIRAYKTALEFYGDEENYVAQIVESGAGGCHFETHIKNDSGARARKAVGK